MWNPVALIAAPVRFFAGAVGGALSLPVKAVSAARNRIFPPQKVRKELAELPKVVGTQAILDLCQTNYTQVIFEGNKKIQPRVVTKEFLAALDKKVNDVFNKWDDTKTAFGKDLDIQDEKFDIFIHEKELAKDGKTVIRGGLSAYVPLSKTIDEGASKSCIQALQYNLDFQNNKPLEPTARIVAKLSLMALVEKPTDDRVRKEYIKRVNMMGDDSFAKEIGHLKTLQGHPSISQIFDGDIDHGVVYTQLGELGDLESYKFRKKSFRDLIPHMPSIALRLLQGLQWIHSKPLVHNDVKPENIVLDKNFNPRFIDFNTTSPEHTCGSAPEEWEVCALKKSTAIQAARDKAVINHFKSEAELAKEARENGADTSKDSESVSPKLADAGDRKNHESGNMSGDLTNLKKALLTDIRKMSGLRSSRQLLQSRRNLVAESSSKRPQVTCKAFPDHLGTPSSFSALRFGYFLDWDSNGNMLKEEEKDKFIRQKWLNLNYCSKRDDLTSIGYILYYLLHEGTNSVYQSFIRDLISFRDTVLALKLGKVSDKDQFRQSRTLEGLKKVQSTISSIDCEALLRGKAGCPTTRNLRVLSATMYNTWKNDNGEIVVEQELFDLMGVIKLAYLKKLNELDAAAIKLAREENKKAAVVPSPVELGKDEDGKAVTRLLGKQIFQGLILKLQSGDFSAEDLLKQYEAPLLALSKDPKWLALTEEEFKALTSEEKQGLMEEPEMKASAEGLEEKSDETTSQKAETSKTMFREMTSRTAFRETLDAVEEDIEEGSGTIQSSDAGGTMSLEDYTTLSGNTLPGGTLDRGDAKKN